MACSTCARDADRNAVIPPVAVTLAVIVVVVGCALLTATPFPWWLDLSESWLSYAATLQ